jgi:hypothetical protein
MLAQEEAALDRSAQMQQAVSAAMEAALFHRP